MLTKKEAAERLNIHEQTLTRWAENGIITCHAYNGHYDLYELPDIETDLPQKQCSRWNTLVDRATARELAAASAKIFTCDNKSEVV
ncbi:helix-turn-helix domain-containing protein [Mesorhizobium sp. M0222]|uniref:helix-turn-helix domain-containing protein n=1 Tax=Mesorhizobium sp. M0222 TaxID=2956921 RepID=UPI00333B7960